MPFSKNIFTIILVLSLSVFPFIVSLALGDDCAGGKDWKDVYILPTNPHPQSNIKVSLSVDKQRVQPDDRITLTFHADRECYLTIMDVGTSGRILRLWPNDLSGSDNRISANTITYFPAPQDGFRYRIAGPEGVDRLIAYATTEKGKILGEQEFRLLQNSAFREFSGDAKNLAITFERRTAALPSQTSWGTAQLNLCISDPRPQPAPAARIPRSEPTLPSPAPGSRPEQKLPGKMCVLALGVPTGELKFSISDAHLFVDALKRKLGVQETNVRRVLGAEATYDGFVSGINWLAAKTQPEDIAVIYFSGHGSNIPDQSPLDEPDGRDECFVLYHTGKLGHWQDAVREKRLMVDDDFNVLVKRIPARKKIIMADCCHSGTINKGLGLEVGDFVGKFYPLRDPKTQEEMWNLKTTSKQTSYGNDNEALLSACLDNEMSYENKKLQASVFTHFLVKAIDEGATDLETAFARAKSNVIQFIQEGSRRTRGQVGEQTPQLTDPHGLAKLLHFSR